MIDIFNINKMRNEKQDLEEQIRILELIKEKVQNNISKLSETVHSMEERKNELDKQLKNRENFFIETELKYIDTLSGLEFENYCCDLLKKNGYVATVTKPTQDSGGDIIASQNDTSYIIQCKNYSDAVGNKAIQEVYTAKGIYKCDKAIVITNNFFTAQAKKEAQMLDIELWDRNYLELLLSCSYHYSINNIDLNLDIIENGELDKDNILEDDPLLNDAITTVVETGQASTSFIQRRFKINYTRAGRIIDQLEERGVISGYQGTKPRAVLWKLEDLEKHIN